MSLPQMMKDVWDNHFESLTPMMKNYLETKKQHEGLHNFLPFR